MGHSYDLGSLGSEIKGAQGRVKLESKRPQCKREITVTFLDMFYSQNKYVCVSLDVISLIPISYFRTFYLMLFIQNAFCSQFLVQFCLLLRTSVSPWNLQTLHAHYVLRVGRVTVWFDFFSTYVCVLRKISLCN